MFVLAETVYLCRTFGELLRMHSGCFCYRSNNVWFWKEQALVSFAEMTCQHVNSKKMALTTPPSLFSDEDLDACSAEMLRESSPMAVGHPMGVGRPWHGKSTQEMEVLMGGNPLNNRGFNRKILCKWTFQWENPLKTQV